MLTTMTNRALVLICIAQKTDALYLSGTLADADLDARASIHRETTPACDDTSGRACGTSMTSGGACCSDWSAHPQLCSAAAYYDDNDFTAKDMCCACGGGAATTSATGDPHLQNLHGERFDLMRPGKFALIHIPRGQPIEDALLVVEADARRLGGHCADMYFQSLNVTGAWADKAQPGGLRFDAVGALDENPKWTKLGPVELKVAHGRTDKGSRYLNVYVKHLGRTGFAVGGLLGEDDHRELEIPTEECHKTLSLSSAKKDLRHSGSFANAM